MRKFTNVFELSIADKLRNAPHGLRKRDLFSPVNTNGHNAFNRLAAMGLIRAEFHSDPANMDSHYVYFWVG
jgi:hypothetical protein